MTNKQIKQEFNRWIDAGRPAVWIQQDSSGSWYKSPTTCWNSSDVAYIVDDEQAELRKLQIDKPDTKFQAYYNNKWTDTTPSWFIDKKYRVKPEEWYEDPAMAGKLVWVRDSKDDDWVINTFNGYASNNSYPFGCGDDMYRYAKPVKPEDLYQEEKDAK